MKKNRNTSKKCPRRLFRRLAYAVSPHIEWGLDDELTGTCRPRLPMQTSPGILSF